MAASFVNKSQSVSGNAMVKQLQAGIASGQITFDIQVKTFCCGYNSFACESIIVIWNLVSNSS